MAVDLLVEVVVQGHIHIHHTVIGLDAGGKQGVPSDGVRCYGGHNASVGLQDRAVQVAVAVGIRQGDGAVLDGSFAQEFLKGVSHIAVVIHCLEGLLQGDVAVNSDPYLVSVDKCLEEEIIV